MSYFANERPAWFRSYAVHAGGPESDFLNYSPPERLTWMDLVTQFASQGLLQTSTQVAPSNPVLHHVGVDGKGTAKHQVITAIGGRKLVQPVDAGKIGSSAAVPYLHAEHLLFGLYKAQGGTLSRCQISGTRMEAAYDLIV